MSLAVSAPPQESCEEASAQLSFRDTAIWYPDIPDKSLIFLGTSGKVYGPGRHWEFPACFTVFGGVNGESTENLSGITVQLRSYDTGSRIDILSIHPRLQSPVGEGLPFLGIQRQGDRVTEENSDIDGPSGERVTGFETSHSYGALEGFKVSWSRRGA